MKKEFLYNALNDAQELIKYIESKTGFVIGLITAIITTIFLISDNIIKYSSNWSFCFWFCFVLLTVGIILSIVIIIKIICPIKSPMDNIKINVKEIPELKYFLFPNDYKNKLLMPFFNSKNSKLRIGFNKYYSGIKNLDDKTIEKVLIIEILKLNYLRNLKADRFNALIIVLVTSAAIFILFFIRYQIELKSIIALHC